VMGKAKHLIYKYYFTVLLRCCSSNVNGSNSQQWCSQLAIVGEMCMHACGSAQEHNNKLGPVWALEL